MRPAGKLAVAGAAAVAAVAAAVALSPHVLLYVPEVGFILYHLAGGPVPPFLSDEMFRPGVVETWARDGDVVVASGPKSGTTMLMQMIHQLRVAAMADVASPEIVERARGFSDVNLVIPWVDVAFYPGQPVADRIRWLAEEIDSEMWNSSAYPFRAWHTHVMPHALPVLRPDGPKLRYISIARNGLDVINSWHRFIPQHSDQFRKMWGGFPPHSESFAETFAMFVPEEVAIPSRHACREWRALKDRDDVLQLHYSDVTRDMDGALRKIAAFLKLSIEESKWPALAAACSIEHMRAIEDRFFLHYNPKAGVPTCIAPRPGAIVGKGGSGGDLDHLAPEMRKAYSEALARMIPDGETREWCEHGDAGYKNG